MITLREQGFTQNLPQPFWQGIAQFGYPQQPLQGIAQPVQQSPQEMSQFGYPQQFLPQQGIGQQGYPQQLQQGFAQPAQQAQQEIPQFWSPQSLPQQAIGQGYLQQPQQGFSQPGQQSQQEMSQFGYPQQFFPQQGYPQQLQQGFAQPVQQPQQEMSQFAFPQQPLPQQGIAQMGYLQQPQQGFAQPGHIQQPQQGFGQRGMQAQQGMAAQLGFAQQPPPQFFGGQVGQFAGGFDVYQQPGRAEFDVPRGRKGPKNYARSDERIRELICERVIQDLSIDASDVGVEVRNGRVTLDGTVRDRRMRHAIEDVVDRCWGVQDIQNDIRVQSGQEPGSSAKGFGQEEGQEGRKVAQSGGGFASTSGTSSGAASGKAAGSESKGKADKE